MKKAFLLTVAFALASFTVASADTLVGVTTRTGVDTINWSQLGGDGTSVPNGFTATSSPNSIIATGTFAGGGPGQILIQGVDWIGNFGNGQSILWTNSPGQGPLSFAFSGGNGNGLSTVGMQIQADFDGAFTAVIQAFGTSGLLGSFSEAGVGNANGDDSAIYLGILDTTAANITSITISLSNCTQDCADFGVNMMSLTQGGGLPPPIPEPSSLLLFGSGLIGVVGVARRRFHV